MATLTASVPVNLRWRGPSGTWYDLANGPRHAREPIPAGEPFDLDDQDADAFLEAFGPPPPDTSPPRLGANHPIGDGLPAATPHPGLIAGLTRQ